MPKDNSEYRVDDRELLLGLYQRLLWDRITPLIPRGITPNAITIFGQLCAIIAAVTAGLATLGMPLLFIVSGVCMLIYLTADNLDGAHARRTGQTSRLGEFLDHGLDGIANTCGLFCTAFMLGIDGNVMLLLFALGSVGFLVPFWEQYRTGLLVIPTAGVSEAVTLIAAVEFFIAISGGPDWMVFSLTRPNIATLLAIVPILGYAMTIFPPLIRGARAGASPREMLPAIFLVLAGLGFAFTAANPILVSVMIAAVACDFVCRLILRRHLPPATRHLARASDALLLLPPMLALAFPTWLSANFWAGVGLCLGVSFYGVRLFTGVRLFVRNP